MLKTGVSGVCLDLFTEQLCQSGLLRPLYLTHGYLLQRCIWQRAWLGTAWNGFYTLGKRVIAGI